MGGTVIQLDLDKGEEKGKGREPGDPYVNHVPAPIYGVSWADPDRKGKRKRRGGAVLI